MTAARVAAIAKAADLAATRRWYQAAGFAVRPATATTEERSLEVERDGLVLQFLADDTPWPGPPSFSGSFYVHIDDVDRVASELAVEIELPWGVEARPWGPRELTVQDPDGYFVTFTEPA